MADTQTTVTTLDIQMLNADRADATTIKLDNPKDSVTREMVSIAMQPAFAKGWFLTNKGEPAMYLGDVTLNQSIKTKLGGEDFYVTPASLTINTNTESESSGEFQVSGAQILGYDYKEMSNSGTGNASITSVRITNNSQTIQIKAKGDSTRSVRYDFYLVIQGERIKSTVYLNHAI